MIILDLVLPAILFFASNFSEKLQVIFHSSAIGKSIVLQTRFYNYEPNI